MGFADHPEEEKYNSTLSLIALGAGAEIIEKHLTLGRLWKWKILNLPLILMNSNFYRTN